MSFLAKAAGFVLVPMGTALVARALMGPNDSVGDVVTKSAAVHAAGAVASWYGSNHLDREWHDFLRGAMWGEGCDAILGGMVLGAAHTVAPAYLNERLPDPNAAAPVSGVKPAEAVGEALKLLARMKRLG